MEDILLNKENVNELLVSVCCITYNHAPYIRQCLDGFMMQKTDFVFEVLIHDDASTDGTTEIIREYEAKYPNIIKPLYEEENQWVKGRRGSAEFNFPRAKGKYIALCEGDDYWTDPNKLQKQVDFMESHPDYSMCFHNTEIIYEDSSNRPTKLRPTGLENRNYTAVELFSEYYSHTSSLLFQAEIFNHPKYIQLLSQKIFCFDTALYTLCATLGNVYGMNDIMSVYRLNSAGISNQFKHNPLLQINSRYKIAEICGGDVYSFNIKTSVNDSTYAWGQLAHGKVSQFISIIKLVVSAHPIGVFSGLINYIKYLINNRC